jgi:4-hydroxy 2-oxovalerate aldolase
MNKIFLLDCTLRDGGFINDWEFGIGSIKSIISRLGKAGVDIIEVGFIDERRNYDENRSVFPDTCSILPIFRHINRPNAVIIAMIDFGTCSIDKILPRQDSCLDGIRVIFKKNDQDRAIEFITRIKEKGYKVFVNPVAITSYTGNEASLLIQKINKINPHAVSVVDTYGLMHSRELLYYLEIFDGELTENVVLGYHAHNNFQMAYANSITLINREFDRPIIIDGSLYGMGKSAGNACTELLAMYMNEFKGRNFNIQQIQEAIDVDILKEYERKPWGYRFEYYIAALNDCHPKYVQYLLDKKSLSVKSIGEILQNIPEDKKLSYEEKHVENLYAGYQDRFFNDVLVLNSLNNEFSNKKILLLGPGKTLQDEREVINEFIGKYSPLIVSINFLNENYPINYVFMSNAKRYSQFFNKLNAQKDKIKIICTSNITEAGERIDYIVNYSCFLVDAEVIRDNPLIMFLQLLKKINIEEIWIAGFDGYVQDNSINYYDEYMRFLYCQENVLLRNDAIRNELKRISIYVKIRSLTPTRYL